MKFRTTITKVAFKKEAFSTSKLKLNLKKKPVKRYSRYIALCGAVTWSLREADQKHLKCGVFRVIPDGACSTNRDKK
jgi:hypothetical protein